MKPHRGALVLSLGILGLVLCQVLGPIAWVLGNEDLRGMDAGEVDPEGRGLVEAGKICGVVATLMMIAVVGLLLILVVGRLLSARL